MCGLFSFSMIDRFEFFCYRRSCPFKSKPLDGHAGPSSESAKCTTPANKTSVPCYFYFNGFCNEGDRCSFMHNSDGNQPAEKSIKPPSVGADAPLLDNKTSAGCETGSATTETLEEFLSLSRTALSCFRAF